MHHKLIALDLDGTLLTTEKTISERAEAAIAAHQKQGTHVVICTGRPPRSALNFAKQINVKHSVNFNGAVIFDNHQSQVKKRFDMDGSEAKRVAEHLLGQHPDIMGLFEAHYGWYCNQAFSDFHFQEERGSGSAIGDAPDDIGQLHHFVQDSVSSFLIRHEELSAETISQSLQGFNVHCTWSSEFYLEISAKGVHKLMALQQLCKELEIKQHNVAAFGNAHNDVEMLKWANVGIAVENASDDAKAAADELTASNDEDGVAQMLETWL